MEGSCILESNKTTFNPYIKHLFCNLTPTPVVWSGRSRRPFSCSLSIPCLKNTCHTYTVLTWPAILHDYPRPQLGIAYQGTGKRHAPLLASLLTNEPIWCNSSSSWQSPLPLGSKVCHHVLTAVLLHMGGCYSKILPKCVHSPIHEITDAFRVQPHTCHVAMRIRDGVCSWQYTWLCDQTTL